MKWSLYVTKINNMNAEYLKKIIPNIATKNKNKHNKKIVKKKPKTADQQQQQQQQHPQ